MNPDQMAALMDSDTSVSALNLDLSLAPDSNLANSVQQLCQAEFGRAVSENGGLRRMVENCVERVNKDVWRSGRENLIADILGDLKDEMREYIDALIRDEIEKRVQPKTNMDVLRERVENFSLVGAE